MAGMTGMQVWLTGITGMTRITVSGTPGMV